MQPINPRLPPARPALEADRMVGVGGKVAHVLSPQEATERMQMATQHLLGLMVLEQEAARGNVEARAWLRQHAEVLRRLLGIT